MSFVDDYEAQRRYETPRRSRKRYTFWVLFIIAVFAFLLGVLIGAAT